MSCYFRHMKDVFEEAGVEITPGNKKEIDRIIHGFMNVEYKNCSPTWKAVKEQVMGEGQVRGRLIKLLKKEIKVT